MPTLLSHSCHQFRSGTIRNIQQSSANVRGKHRLPKKNQIVVIILLGLGADFVRSRYCMLNNAHLKAGGDDQSMNIDLTRAPENLWQSAEKEYYFLQAEVGRFDQIAIGIKNWSITIGVALLTAAVYKDLPILYLTSAISSLLFWMTEARWKRYQRLHIERIKEVEAYLMGRRGDYAGPAINQSFVRLLGTLNSTRRDEFRIMLLGNVRLPHMPMIVLGIGLYVLTTFGVVPATKAEQQKTSCLTTDNIEVELLEDFLTAERTETLRGDNAASWGDYIFPSTPNSAIRKSTVA